MPRIYAAIGGILTKLVQKVADIVQQGRYDQSVIGAVYTCMISALLGMFALADILAVMIVAPRSIEMKDLVDSIGG